MLYSRFEKRDIASLASLTPENLKALVKDFTDQGETLFETEGFAPVESAR
jgi:hypothetical protein